MNPQITHNKESHNAMQEVIFTYMDKFAKQEKILQSERNVLSRTKKDLIEYKSVLADRERKAAKLSENIKEVEKEKIFNTK